MRQDGRTRYPEDGFALLRVKDAELIEETADRVSVPLPGNMRQAGTVGGLFFGLHVLREIHLHTAKNARAKGRG